MYLLVQAQYYKICLLVFVERKTRKKKLGKTATQTYYAGIDEYAIPAPWLDLRAREITFGNSKDD